MSIPAESGGIPEFWEIPVDSIGILEFREIPADSSGICGGLKSIVQDTHANYYHAIAPNVIVYCSIVHQLSVEWEY